MLSRTRGRARKTSTSQPLAKASPTSELPNLDSGLSASRLEMLRKLYAALLRCRMVHEHLRQWPAWEDLAQRYAWAAGGEAATVGTTAELHADDTIVASPQDLAAMLARGASLGALLSTSNERCLACSAAPVLPNDIFNTGVGIALAHKLEQKQRVVVALCCEPAPALDARKDAFHVAATQKLPVIFVVENDIAMESSGNGATHYLDALSYAVCHTRLPEIVVDGSDVVGIWRVAQEAVHRARNGWGPTLIACRSDPARDPLTHLEHYLRKHLAWDEAWRREVEAQVRSEIKRAFTATAAFE